MRKITPYSQLAFIFIGSLLIMLLIKSLGGGADAYFTVAFSAMILFIVGNAMIGIFADKWIRYIIPSVIGFGLLMFLELMVCKYFSGSSIFDQNAFKMMLPTIIIFYLIVSGISRFIKFVYSFSNDS